MPHTDYSTPHLLGRVKYPQNTSFAPDGDTIHLIDPVLLIHGTAIPPVEDRIRVSVPGATRTIKLKRNQSVGAYAPIRFEGIDAPEEHYTSQGFDGHKKRPNQHERCQPRWSPATRYVLSVLESAGWALVELDSEVVDGHGRVLGYVYASNSKGKKGKFVSLELLRRGLAFPFVFESARDYIERFLSAGAKARREKKGVWKNYRDKPLPLSASFPAPHSHEDVEPIAQLNAPLNLPVVFRRVVDSHQLVGLTLKKALQKYDAIEYPSGDWVPGDRYFEIPIDRRIWAPRAYS